nr:energy transducer TonB [Roseivirga sp. E12]
MNFDSVVKGASIWAGFKIGSALLKLGTKVSTAVVAGTSTVVVTAAVVVATNTDLLKSSGDSSPQPESQAIEELLPVEKDSVTQEETIVAAKVDSLDANAVQPAPLQTKKPKKVSVPVVTSNNSADSIKAEDIIVEARPLPDFQTFKDFVDRELKYPVDPIGVGINEETEEKEALEGYVEVFWTINKEGKAENFKIRKSMGQAFDNEAIRVLKLYQNWQPASFNGSAVDSNLRFKVNFRVK